MTIKEFDVQQALGSLLLSIDHRFNIRPKEHLEYSCLTLKFNGKEYRIENHLWMLKVKTAINGKTIQHKALRTILIDAGILT